MRRVKNSFISLVLVIALGLSLVSCNSSKDTLAAGADLSSLATELTSQIEFKDKDLAPLNKELWDRYMTQVDFDDVKNAEIVAGGGFIAEEIALFEAVDADAAGRIEKAMQARYEEFRNSYANYTPEELKNLEEPALITNGNYVFSVFCADNDQAREIINNWISEQSA